MSTATETLIGQAIYNANKSLTTAQLMGLESILTKHALVFSIDPLDFG